MLVFGGERTNHSREPCANRLIDVDYWLNMLVRSDRAQGQVRTVTDVVPAKMAGAFGKAVVILKLMI